MSNLINPRLGIFHKTPRVPLASLPSAALFQAITRYEISDYGGNIATAVGGVWRFEFPFRTTWANRPPVNLVPIGTELQVTDYASQKWICDGTYWRPAQGRVTIGQQWGRVGQPLASLSGSASFTIPGGNPLIRAGMIIPHSRVYCETFVRKDGVNAAANFYGWLNIVGAVAPGTAFLTSSINNTNLQCARYFASAKFGTARNSFFTEQHTAPANQNTNSFVDKTFEKD